MTGTGPPATRRRRPASAAWGLLFALPALSGCLGGEGGAPQSGLNGGSLVASDGAELSGPNGAIRGFVQNENGARLAGAHVVLIGLPLYADTDKKGAFHIPEVPPGSQQLRADVQGYLALEHAVEVVPGKEVDVVVVLISNERSMGFREHTHNLWGDEATLGIFDDDLSVPSDTLHGGARGVCVRTPAVSSYSATCYELPIVPEAGHIIRPGTARLDVTLTWQRTDTMPTLLFQHMAANETKWRQQPVQSGQTFSITVTDGMNDHGHQAYSLWGLRAVIDPRLAREANGGVQLMVDEWVEEFVGTIHAKVIAHRGDFIPTEPAHTRYWSAPSLVLVEGETHTVSGAPTERTRDARAQTCAAADLCFTLPKGKLVPPGTTRLEVVLSYTSGTPALDSHFSAKSLAFRTAELQPQRAAVADLRVEPPASKAPGKAVWDLKLNDREADFFYQSKSVWMLLAAKEGGERDRTYTVECFTVLAGCGGDKFTLRVVAHNDDWTPELAGG